MFLQIVLQTFEPGLPASRPWGLYDYVAYGLGGFLLLWFVSLLIRPKVAIKNWNHHFEGLQIGSRDLYQQIISKVKERQIPDVSMYYARYFAYGIFSPRREYLSIEYKKFSMDVCCIAFGTGYYVSWWLGREDPGFFSRVPILNDLLGMNPKHPSYYQLDTATLFQSGVHDAILSVIDEITEGRGLRKLTELERIANGRH